MSVNYLPVALTGEITEMVVLAILHLILIYRIRSARVFASAQREVDLQRFRELAAVAAPTPASSTPHE